MLHARAPVSCRHPRKAEAFTFLRFESENHPNNDAVSVPAPGRKRNRNVGMQYQPVRPSEKHAPRSRKTRRMTALRENRTLARQDQPYRTYRSLIGGRIAVSTPMRNTGTFGGRSVAQPRSQWHHVRFLLRRRYFDEEPNSLAWLNGCPCNVSLSRGELAAAT